MQISEQTFYRWKRTFRGMGVAEVRRPKLLEKDNRKLKRLVADLSLDKALLQDAPRTPSHGSGGCGARHGSAPTGNAAKEMPLNETTSPSPTPRTLPDTVSTTGPCGGAPTALSAIAHASARLAKVTDLLYVAVITIVPLGRITALPVAAPRACP
jgi:hypothetical protein